MVILVLAIVFTVFYGVSAYLFKRSLVKNSSMLDLHKRKLLRLITCCMQWFVFGYPAAALITPIEIVWIKWLLAVIEIASLVIAIAATVIIRKNESFVEVLQSKSVPVVIVAIGIVMCIFIIINMF